MMGEAPDPNTVIVDPREGGQKLLQFLPVSYTHLTLPTKA